MGVLSGAEVVRERLVDVCKDLTHRYDIDGTHLDDYFYPYPIDGEDFPDNLTWNAYQAASMHGVESQGVVVDVA